MVILRIVLEDLCSLLVLKGADKLLDAYTRVLFPPFFAIDEPVSGQFLSRGFLSLVRTYIFLESSTLNLRARRNRSCQLLAWRSPEGGLCPARNTPKSTCPSFGYIPLPLADSAAGRPGRPALASCSRGGHSGASGRKWDIRSRRTWDQVVVPWVQGEQPLWVSLGTRMDI